MYKITTAPDLNDLVDNGIYLISATSSINAPTGVTQNGILIVFRSVGTPCQFFIPDNQPVIYKRWSTGGGSTTFKGWYKSSTFTAV